MFFSGGHGGYHCHLRGGGCSPHRWPACPSWCRLRLHTIQVRLYSNKLGDVIVWHLSAITQVSSEATNFNIHLSARLTNIKFCRGFVHLGAGLSVGLSGLAAGYAIGIVGDAGVRGTAQQPRLFVGMILILIFAEVLGLYGLIVAIYLYAKK